MKFSVNGSSVEATPAAGQVLQTVLRDLDHFEVKMGCGSGDCGACTVLLDGEPIHSCIYPAHRLEGAAITTVSGSRSTRAFTRHTGSRERRSPPFRGSAARSIRIRCSNRLSRQPGSNADSAPPE